ncbi:hypothetical protein J2128_001860 [Methanomicrobium sp. W14]|uniref:hypothetical protein n=1 Tax=Methanomicrobium sp. W14 TaxID=2817839 RepID=UPI001AE923CF|nr:hypothetical protein [Methanomicrobium sp. W14]MBP2133906.1 hypothetical protein [Methanomicrobium sp. W14]
MMKIADIFEIESPVCIEPALMDHTEDGYTNMVLSMETECGRLLVDENEDPVAVAFHDKNGWFVSSYLYRPFSPDILELFETCSGDIYQEKREVYEGALREYYCGDILSEFPEVIEDNRPGRYEMIESLLSELLGEGNNKTALDFCCGSGVASKVLSDMGYKTLSFDYDASLISCGLQHERLSPERTICIDGTDASVFCSPSFAGTGLMFGDITSFNASMWEDITAELFSLSEKTVISVATEREIRMIGEWCRDAGRKPEIIENDRDPIYDAWVCYSEK